MTNIKKTFLAACMVLGGAATGAHADVYTIDVYTGDVGHSFNVVMSSPAKLFNSGNNSQHARFTYTGTLDFSDAAAQDATASGDLNSVFFGANAAGISNYIPITTLANADYGSFATLSSFLAASGSVAGYGYGSYYVIADQAPQAAGTKLSILHDDGVGVYVNNGFLPGTVSGPTAAVTDTVTLPAAPGYTLYYGRENGAPSTLTVAVPEPMSATLLGAGLLGVGMARRRRRG